MVSLRDYEGIQGFGMATAQDVDDLNKALYAGTGRGGDASTGVPAGGAGGGALRVESLEATLRVVTYTLGHIKFWKMLSKLPAFNTVEEYNQLTQYGADNGAFTKEGELPESQDSTYERKTALIKFLGTTREVSHPMTLVRPAHGNVIGLETQNGAIWLLERLERALFYGRSDNVSEEIDGLIKQIFDGAGIADPNTDLYSATDTLKAGAETIIIDKRGASLTEDDLETATNYVVQNYGTPTDLLLSPRAMSDLAKLFYPRERVNLPAPVDGKVGMTVTSFVSQAGPVQFQPDIFLRPGRNGGVKTAPSAATSGKAPATPTVSAGTSDADAKSMFKAADLASYYWRVTAFNRYGESAPVDSAQVAVDAVGDAVTLTITAGTENAYPATGFKIYRSDKNAAASTGKLIATIKRPASTITYVDRNWFLPGCGNSMLVQNNLQNYAVRQLAPMLKIPLATIGPSIRWMQLLYLTFILYTPKKNLLFINVKDD